MKFLIRHADGQLEFEANSAKYARRKARLLANRNGLENGELFGWHQHWTGETVTWEGWQHEAYL